MTLRVLASFATLFFATKLGLAQTSFLPNGGQWDDFVEYRAELSTGKLWMEKSGWTAWVAGPGYDELWAHEDLNGDGRPDSLYAHAWKVEFVNSNPQPFTSGREEYSHRVNYYRGSDPSKWASDLVPYNTVVYEDVWPGVRLKMSAKGSNDLKYDWIVAPGADPKNIVLQHFGTSPKLLGGRIIHNLGTAGEAVEGIPFAYQLVGSKIVEVECEYKLSKQQDGSTLVKFKLGSYDDSLPLTIDPDIAFSTFIGASQANWGFTAAFDDDGRGIGGAALWDGGMGTYPTTAGAIATNFAAGNGPFDIGISVFSPLGNNLEYSTIAGGDGMDIPSSMVSDSNGELYVLGTTGSADFPTTAGAYDVTFNGGPYEDLTCCNFPGYFNSGSDLFVLKFAAGTAGLISGTYIGGTDNDGINSGIDLNYNYGDVFRGEINIDDLDRPWVAATTSSTNFPMVQGPYPSYNGGETDGVLLRMSPALNVLEWSCYVGGSNADAAYGVQFTSAFEPVVCGGTRSTDYPALGSSYQWNIAGGADAFVTRFPNGGGTPLASTFFGSNSYDQSYFVQVDDDDLIYLYGQTTGDIPLVGNVYDASPDAGQFVACFDTQLQNLQWNTRVGTDNTWDIDISPTAFLVSDCGQIYLSGWGGNTNGMGGTDDMPITDDAFQSGTDNSDFWFGLLSQGAEDLIYGSFLGGSQSAEHVDGGTSRFDKNGTVYQAVCAGCGGNSDFPTTPGAWSSTNDSFNCNMALFKFDLGLIDPNIDLNAPDVICPEEPIQFLNNSIGGGEYLWEFGDGTTSTEFEPTHTFETNGYWVVTLTVSDPLGCLEPQSTTIDLNIEEPPAPTVDLVDPICLGESVQLNAWGSPDLYWLQDASLSATNIPDPIATPTQTTTYIAHDENECGAVQAEVTVIVSEVEAEVNTPATAICLGDNVQLSASGGTTYDWEPTLGLSNPASDVVEASPNVTTDYTITVSNQYGCEDSENILVTVVPGPPEGVVHDPINICTGYSTSLPAGDGDSWLWEPSTNLNDDDVQHPIASPTTNTTYQVSIANLCGIGVDEVTVNVIVPEAYASENGGICRGNEFTVSASGNDVESTYNWQPQQLVSQSTSQTTTVFPVETQTFTVYVTDSNGCTASDELTVYVSQPPEVDAGPDREVEWLDRVRLLGAAAGDTYWWTPEELLSCSYCIQPEVLSAEPGWFVLHSLDSVGCEGVDSVFIDVFFPVYVPNTFTPNNDGRNDVFRVYGERLEGYRLIIYNRWGEQVFYSEDPEEVWTGGRQGGDYYYPDGMYLYTLRFEEAGGPRIIEGHTYLLR